VVPTQDNNAFFGNVGKHWINVVKLDWSVLFTRCWIETKYLLWTLCSKLEGFKVKKNWALANVFGGVQFGSAEQWWENERNTIRSRVRYPGNLSLNEYVSWGRY
jgi:hypothetical protein